MDISRGYKPLFKTPITALAKVKLPSQKELPNEEAYKAIAAVALQEDGDNKEYKMNIYYDCIRFDKSSDGSTFPIIPFASIMRMLVLPNFPDVCFMHFRRSTYGMYVVFRVGQLDILTQLAKQITLWQESSYSDVESTESHEKPPKKSTKEKKEKAPKPPKNENNYAPPPVKSVKKKKSKQKYEEDKKPSHKSRSKHLPSESTQLDGDECQFVCIKHNHQPHKVHHRKYRSQSPQERRVESYYIRSRSEPRSSESESIIVFNDYEFAPEMRSGKYKLIKPTPKKLTTPPKGYRRRIIHVGNNRMESERVIVAKNSSSSGTTQTTSNASEFYDMYGREVKTIYPSYMDPSRMTPRSRHNERLIHAFHKPISSFD